MACLMVQRRTHDRARIHLAVFFVSSMYDRALMHGLTRTAENNLHLWSDVMCFLAAYASRLD
jgi:hypothetical protein